MSLISVTKRQDIVIGKYNFFPEITDLWAKSLTVYLICDKSEHKARKEYRITQINKDYYFARESINKVSYFVSYEIQSMSAALRCGRQRVFKLYVFFEWSH